jgi:hypothetical protein
VLDDPAHRKGERLRYRRRNRRGQFGGSPGCSH